MSRLTKLSGHLDRYRHLFALPDHIVLSVTRSKKMYGWCDWVSSSPDTVHIQVTNLAFQDGVEVESLLHELAHAEQARAGRDLNHDAAFIRRLAEISRATGYKELL